VPVDVARAILLFGLAGLAEIGGGWLVWQWLRESKPWPLGLLGAQF
jgi:small multidrug resistance family-3 protein